MASPTGLQRARREQLQQLLLAEMDRDGMARVVIRGFRVSVVRLSRQVLWLLERLGGARSDEVRSGQEVAPQAAVAAVAAALFELVEGEDEGRG